MQKMIALKKANGVRLDRASLKRGLKTGDQLLSSLILETPGYLERVSVLDVLTWMPRVGERRAKRLTSRLVYTETLTLADLSPATREELARRVAIVEVHRSGGRPSVGTGRVVQEVGVAA